MIFKIKHRLTYNATGNSYEKEVAYIADNVEDALNQFWDNRRGNVIFTREILTINDKPFEKPKGEWVEL